MRFVYLSVTVILMVIGNPGLCAEVIGLPRVALVYSDYGDFRHRDDYDGKMENLGWPMDKYENTEFDELVEKLGHYDIVLGSALYNYSNVQDFSVHHKRLLGFMRRGGAIVWTDTNYAPHVNWLAGLGESWEVATERAPGTGTPMKSLDEEHPIFNVPNEVRNVSGTWAHMQPGDGWQVISTSEDGQATGLFRRHGRGFMMLTCYWAYGTQMLENIWGALQLYRAGLVPTLPQYGDFGLGTNTAQMSVNNITDAARDFTVSATVIGPAGARKQYDASANIEAGATESLTLQIPLEPRGDYQINTAFKSGGRAFYSWRYDGPHIPDLLTVKLLRPRYRGAVYAAAPPDQVELEVALHPYKQDIADFSLVARLTQDGEMLQTRQLRRLPGRQFAISLPLTLKSENDMQLNVRLSEQDEETARAEVTRTIRVVRAQPNQVFVGPDLATWVDGSKYFPIGIYHVGTEDLPQVKQMGFNCFQGWGTTAERARQSLDAAEEHGMKCILELSGFLRGSYNPEGLADIVSRFADHPGLLAWYIVDEPHGDEQFSWCDAAHRHIVANEPNHPVYLVMCSPGSFERFAPTTDILAVDPYPIPASVTMVSDWMQRAQEAVGRAMPIWLIPQLHNKIAYRDPDAGRGPTPAEERNMVYQGLIWGAKGIVYYPWDDGPCGLVHDEALMEAVTRINGELATLGPPLLDCDREVTARNDDEHPDLYGAIFTGPENTYIIAASVADEEREFSVPAPGLQDGELEVMFEDRACQIEDGSIVDTFGPLEVHVYRRR